MDTILIEVHVPSLNNVFDIVVSPLVYTCEFAEMLTQMIGETVASSAIYENAFIVDGATGNKLDDTMTLYSQNIINGAKLILF